MPIYFKPFIQDLPLTLESIGNHWCQEPIHRPKGYPLYHWLQTESGQGIITLPKGEISLNVGEGLLIAPHIPHHYTKATDNWITSFITFNGTMANDIYKICGEEPYLFVNSQEGEYFRKWIDQTIHSYLENSIDALRLSVSCYELFMHFSNIYINNSLTKHPLYQQYVAPVIINIETHYAENLDVDILAAGIHITPQYLTRLFHRFTGYSVRSYITRFRINKAKELLIRKPYLKIQIICHMTGYNDVSYFTSVFKSHTGITPRQFRKSYGFSADLEEN